MKPYRPEKVGREVQQIISDTIRNHLQDPRISPMTSITRVEVSADLEWAKVHVSVYGDSAAQNRTMAALQHAAGYIQKRLARTLPIRQCPQLLFQLDDSLKRSFEINQTIDASINDLRPTTAAPAAGGDATAESSEGTTP